MQIKFLFRRKTMPLETNTRSTYSLIKEDVEHQWKDMTSIRRVTFIVFFALSLIIPTIFVLYESDDDSPPVVKLEEEISPMPWRSMYDPRVYDTWDTVVLENQDIIGPIINPANSDNGSINLILTSKGQLFHYDAASIINCTDEETGGRVISINPIDKKIKWEKFFDYGHIDVACSMLRVNDECLIVIKNYSVISINATTGADLWRQPWNDDYNWAFGDNRFPIILPDLNADGFYELAAIVNSKKIIILSGRDGAHLKEEYNENCTSIKKLIINLPDELNYTCVATNGAERTEIMNLSEYFNVNKTNVDANPLQNFKMTPIDESNLDEYKLRVSRNGTTFCPMNCNTTLTILVGSKEIWTKAYENTVTGNPIPYKIGEYAGFILKKWAYYPHWQNSQNATMFHKRGGDIKAYRVRQRMLIILVVKDYIEPFLVEDYTIQRFAIVTLLCIQNECQPDYKTQLDDMLILDTNNDGRQDMATYSSTYSNEDDYKPDYSMLSTVYIMKLEEILITTYYYLLHQN